MKKNTLKYKDITFAGDRMFLAFVSAVKREKKKICACVKCTIQWMYKDSCHKINDRSTIQYGVRNSQSKLHMVMKQYNWPDQND